MSVSNTKYIFDIIIVSFLEYFGDASFKYYARTNDMKYLISGIICYSIVLYLLIQILRYANVMQMNIGWDAISVILETVFAYLFLRETLSGVTQYIGFILIILGMIFMNLGKINYK